MVCQPFHCGTMNLFKCCGKVKVVNGFMVAKEGSRRPCLQASRGAWAVLHLWTSKGILVCPSAAVLMEGRQRNRTKTITKDGSKNTKLWRIAEFARDADERQGVMNKPGFYSANPLTEGKGGKIAKREEPRGEDVFNASFLFSYCTTFVCVA